MEKLVAYSLYLPAEDVTKLREMAKRRKAAAFIRNAVAGAFEHKDAYANGYNTGLRDACKVIKETKEASMHLIGNDRLGDILIERIGMLEDNGK